MVHVVERAGRNGGAHILTCFATVRLIRQAPAAVRCTVYSAHPHDTQTLTRVIPSLSERRWFDSFLAWYFVAIWGSGFLATKIGLQYAAPFKVVPSALSGIGIAITCAGVALVAWKR